MFRGVLRIAMLVAIGVAIVASVTAQEPASRAPVPVPDKDKVVFTGCLQRAAQLPVGTSGAVGDTDVTKFILMKATSATDKDAAAARTYRLDADDSLLTTHVGHKVEITGTLDSAAKPSASVTGDPAPPAAAGASKLKVTSVKMIAAACE